MTNVRGARVPVAATLLAGAYATVTLAGDVVLPLPPDYEQARTGLPNSGGAYCGPASAADFMQWLDDNGFPGIVFPAATEADITAELAELGTYISTDEDGGTSPDDFVAGLQAYLDDSGNAGVLEVSYVGRNMGSEIEQALGHSFSTILTLLGAEMLPSPGSAGTRRAAPAAAATTSP